MPDSVTTAAPKLRADCSFCGKPRTDVKKLIAGPGIYICDECVGLCQEIISTDSTSEEAAAAVAAFDNKPPAEMLNALPMFTRAIASVERDLRAWVVKLRHDGVSWSDIGSRLELDAEAARARFERAED